MATIKQTLTRVNNGETYYAKVFTVNPKERVNLRADLAYVSAVPMAFPAKPESEADYTLYRSYGAGKSTFTAPEDGWYKIIVYGPSGNGGDGDNDDKSGVGAFAAGGGGGGGGAVAISIVKMNKDDTVVFSNASVGNTSTATFNATAGERYSNITVTSGEAGDDGKVYVGGYFGASYARGGTGGNGGEATGGTYNYNGYKGRNGGEESSEDADDYVSVEGGERGSPGYTGGRYGGTGGDERNSGDDGQNGYSEVYRGNTNVVA